MTSIIGHVLQSPSGSSERFFEAHRAVRRQPPGDG
jgi:hypothetical protein